MMLRTRFARALAALVVGAAGGTLVSAGAAFAAACPAGTGVTVVVDSSVRCVGSGGSAASSFGAAGHSLTYAKRQPGFVCRVNGAPASDPCVNASPTDAYWALFWSDGKSGKWTYSNQGAGSLKVPTGGWVAFKFQTSNSTSYPGVRPYTAPPAPAPKPKPKPAATAKPKATAPAAKPKPSASASAGASATANPKSSSAAPEPSASASATAAAEAREEALERTAQQSDDSPASTLWVGSLLALALLIGMGATIWQRRARRS